MDRADYLETLAPLAVRLVCAVHDEGPASTTATLAAIAALPRPENIDPMTALAVILAAMVDPERSVDDTLGWVRNLDHDSNPAAAITAADERASLFVELALAGKVPARALANDEGAEVVRHLKDRGWREDQIREHLDDPQGDLVHRWVARYHSANNRARKREAAA